MDIVYGRLTNCTSHLTSWLFRRKKSHTWNGRCKRSKWSKQPLWRNLWNTFPLLLRNWILVISMYSFLPTSLSPAPNKSWICFLTGKHFEKLITQTYTLSHLENGRNVGMQYQDRHLLFCEYLYASCMFSQAFKIESWDWCIKDAFCSNYSWASHWQRHSHSSGETMYKLV